MPAPQPFPRATLRRRAIAAALDHLLAMGFASMAAILLHSLQVSLLWSMLSQVALFFLYFFLLTALWSKTVGKALLGLQVAMTETGQPPGWWPSWKREVWGRFCCMWLSPLGYVTARSRKSPRQTLADLLAGTVVLHCKKRCELKALDPK